MTALKNKEILKYCPDYYKIINNDILEDDPVSIKLIQVLQEYIFGIDITNETQIKLVKKFNEALNKYFDDGEFKKELINTISTLRIKVGTDNVLEFIVKKIIESYDKYLEYYTRNLYIPRWIWFTFLKKCDIIYKLFK